MADIPSGIGTSALLFIGVAINEELEALSDQDWYRVQLVAGTTYAFAMTGLPTRGVEDPYLSIHNANGTLLALNDDGSVGLDSLLTFTAPSSGSYFLNATSYRGEYTGRYELISTIVSTAPIDDLPGDTSTTRALAVGGSVNATIETSDDQDAVFIDLVAGRTYVFEALGIDAGLGLTLADPYLVVAGADAIVIAENDDFGATYNSRITFTPVASGRFYLGVFDIGGDTGTYRITATQTAVADPFIGGPGTDVLVGDNGDNTLRGFGGDDSLDGRGGQDRLYGGDGNDTYGIDSQSDLIFENAFEGYDAVFTTVSHYMFDNVEGLELASGAGAIFGVGNILDNDMLGNESANLMIGGAGDDAIGGEAGNDALFGEDGADLLIGGAGIDYLVGGDDGDILDGGSDADALYGEDGDDALIGGDDFATDILVAGAGNDLLDGSSGLGDYDLMYGGAGDDSYFVDTPSDLTFEDSGGGTDTVIASITGAGYYLYANVENLILEGNTPFGVGNELDNQLVGSELDNWLLGGAGADRIDGGNGNDVLFGEAGADVFVFSAGAGADVIGDFQPGVDRIDLTATGLTSYGEITAAMVEVGGTTAIGLGFGNLIVLNGIANSQLSATDFLI